MDQGQSGSILGKELCPLLHLGVVAIEKGAFGCQLYFTYIYIYIYIYVCVSLCKCKNDSILNNPKGFICLKTMFTHSYHKTTNG